MTRSRRSIESAVEDLSDDDGVTYEKKASWVQFIGGTPKSPESAPLAEGDRLNPENPHHRRWVGAHPQTGDLSDAEAREAIRAINSSEDSAE